MFECSPSTLIELLQGRADRQPDDQAYIFLADGESLDSSITYQALDQRARSLAVKIGSMLKSGDRALLLYPPGLEFIAAFFGCLYAGVVAVPAYPPSRKRPLTALQAIVADTQATLVLTASSLLSNGGPRTEHLPDLRAVRWLATDSEVDDQADQWRKPAVSAESLALLQYTSGSTSLPRGVMISHGNLLSNQRLIRQAFQHTAESTVVSWLPLYHDMGLIGAVLQPLYVGARSILMPPAAFLHRPVRWLQAISRYQAHTSGGPNFAYDLCVRQISPEQRAALDLQSWTIAFNGAEPIRAETLERFTETFAPCGFRRQTFYPCYGLAEATLFVSGGSPVVPPLVRDVQAAALEQNRIVPSNAGKGPRRSLVGCGRPADGLQVITVPLESSTRCPAGQVGEIWVAGPSVGQGYWNRPEETQQTFRAHLADGTGPFLRTGDLGFLQDGELYVTGRLKDLVIIRGRNYYPQDIERTASLSHWALRPDFAAAFSVEIDEERLVVVHEVDRAFRASAAEQAIRASRAAVATEHELQAYSIALIKTNSLPVTSSGKVQRRLCRARFLAGELEVLACDVLEAESCERGENGLTREALLALEREARCPALETYLRRLLARHLRVAADRLDLQQPLTALGLDSLMAVEVKNRIDEDLEVDLPITHFLRTAGITQLAVDILALITTPASPRAALTNSLHTNAFHPLSAGQRALWFLHRLDPESTAYHIVRALRILSDLDITAFRRALQQLVDRHPQLRAVFATQDGEPVQRIVPAQTLFLREIDASDWDDATLQKILQEQTRCPFDLEKGPLFRVVLLRRSEREYVLLWAMHHIVADFWSLALLLREFSLLYRPGLAAPIDTLLSLNVQYTDFVRRQAEMLAGPRGETLRDYWGTQLAGGVPTLNLPVGHPVAIGRTGSQSWNLDATTTRQLRTLGRAHGATLYMTLLAAFQVLLHRYTGQDSFVIGSPTLGRREADLADVVGYFVNPVALRADLSGDPAFTEVLGRVRRTVLAAFEHQDFPFPLLVEQLGLQRDPSRPSLFQVLFTLQKAPFLDEQGLTPLALGGSGNRLSLGTLEMESLALELPAAQADLDLAAVEVADGLKGYLNYPDERFRPSVIARMVEHFLTLLRNIAAQPECRIGSLALMTPQQRQELLHPCSAGTDYRGGRLLQEIFEEQAARAPDKSVAVGLGFTLTYAGLNARAQQLANLILAIRELEGIREISKRPERNPPQLPLIGLLLDQHPGLIQGLLGALKAGSGFVPLNRQDPIERLGFTVKDCRLTILITEAQYLDKIRAVAKLCPDLRHVIVLDQPTGERKSEDALTLYGQAAIQLQSSAKSPIVADPDGVAYVVYTSGTTGQPKGVPITHRNLNPLLYWQREVFHLDESVRTLQTLSPCFDFGIQEILTTILFGGTLFFADRDILRTPRRYVDFINTHGISMIYSTPSLFKEVLIGQRLDSVRLILLGGETLYWETIDRLFEHVRQDCVVFNGYGPTEATINCAMFCADHTSTRRDLRAGSVPIGTASANSRLYLLEKNLEPVPPGSAGEVYIGGPGVAWGYLYRPGLSAARFVPDPFGNEPGARLYKTGDLARYLEDGNIEFLGRTDDQVKIRGFRIELGEIEAVLKLHSAVSECVVRARGDDASNQQLVAYLILKEQWSEAIGEIRQFARDRLPGYMVPSTFLVLADLPLTPNGKIDRRALSALEGVRREPLKASLPLRTELEQMIAAVWRDALHVEHVGREDNFFELGGHSLLAAKVHHQMVQALGRDFPVSKMFEYPTTWSLVKYLTQGEVEDCRTPHSCSRDPGSSQGINGKVLERAEQQKRATQRLKQRRDERREQASHG